MEFMSTNQSIGTNFLKQVLASTKATISFDQFMQSLRLDSIGGAKMPEDDFLSWLDSLGFRVAESQKLYFGVKPHERVLERIKGSFTQPNMIPTRKTIDSAFLDIGYKPTFFDVAKLIASQTVSAGGQVLTTATQTASNVVTAATGTVSAASNIVKFLPYIIYIGIPVGLYILWQARGAVVGAGVRAVRKAAGDR